MANLSAAYKLFGSLNNRILTEALMTIVKDLQRQHLIQQSRENVLRLYHLWFGIKPDTPLRKLNLVKANARRFLHELAEMRESVEKEYGKNLRGIDITLSNLVAITKDFPLDAFRRLLEVTCETCLIN